MAGIALAAVAGSAALAADVAETVTPVPPALTYFHGGFEAGGRFVDRPPSGFGRAPNGDFLTPSQTQSRAKFEEYGEVRSAPMLEWINLQFGTTDGRYAVDFWGKNVGLDNQSYWLDIAKPGEHYLTFGYDETPRLFSTSAKTLFRGTPTFLTVPDAVQAALQAQLPNAAANTAAGATARRNIETIINGNAAGPLTLKVDREKAIVAYRYTPTPNLEFRADYSREERTGSRLNSINWGWGTAANPRPTNFVEVPYPINDLTQNASFTGQYTGLSFWDLPFTANLRYSASLYENAIPFFLAENPFCISCDPLAGTNRGPNLLRQSENPDNQAHALRFSTGIDLPWKSRYMGTFQYQRMRQDDPFINTAINGLVPAAYPAASLDARTNTVLANNVLTTQITPELKSTLRYRYYDVDNVSPILTFTNYIYGDSGFSTGAQNPRIAIPIQYTKENASGEITWRPLRWMNLGAVYGWERYDRDRRSVDVTDEHSGKIYVDANPVDWMRARASFLYGERRYGTYDEFNFEEKPRGILTEGQLAQMRKFDVADRNRKKAEAQVEITPFQLVTITPNFGLRYDDFPDSIQNQLGVSQDRSWNAGIEVGLTLDPSIRVLAAYNYETRNLKLADCCGGAPATDIPGNTWRSDVEQRFNTLMAALDWKAIPNKLEFRFEYLEARALESNTTFNCITGLANCTTDPQFPDEKNRFQRFNATARYIVDPSFVRSMGWNGEVVAKLRYTWERNHNANWATDQLTPYIATADPAITDLTGGNRSAFLAAINPRYDAQILAASLQLRW